MPQRQQWSSRTLRSDKACFAKGIELSRVIMRHRLVVNCTMNHQVRLGTQYKTSRVMCLCMYMTSESTRIWPHIMCNKLWTTPNSSIWANTGKNKKESTGKIASGYFPSEWRIKSSLPSKELKYKETKDSFATIYVYECRKHLKTSFISLWVAWSTILNSISAYIKTLSGTVHALQGSTLRHKIERLPYFVINSLSILFSAFLSTSTSSF